MEEKKLKRNSSNKMLSGVCSGLADYFNTDASLMRILFVLIGIFTAVIPCLIVYVVMAIMIPEE